MKDDLKKNEGKTSLYCGECVGKNNPRIEALGSLDELTSMLGVFRGIAYSGNFNAISYKVSKLILDIQIRLFTVGTEISTGEHSLPDILNKISKEDVFGLEKLIEQFEKTFPIPKGFIIPGGRHETGHLEFHIPSFLDVCRAITRRLERDVISVRSQMIEPANEDFSIMIEWINKLSDVLWLLARIVEIPQGKSLELADIKNQKIDYTF